MTSQPASSAPAPRPDAGSIGGPGAGPAESGDGIAPWLREILRCPACRSELRDGQGPTGGPELQCVDPACGLAYRVDDGIPVLLVDEARSPRG